MLGTIIFPNRGTETQSMGCNFGSVEAPKKNVQPTKTFKPHFDGSCVCFARSCEYTPLCSAPVNSKKGRDKHQHEGKRTDILTTPNQSLRFPHQLGQESRQL